MVLLPAHLCSVLLCALASDNPMGLVPDRPLRLAVDFLDDLQVDCSCQSRFNEEGDIESNQLCNKVES